jgi:hypothetical protein
VQDNTAAVLESIRDLEVQHTIDTRDTHRTDYLFQRIQREV